MSLTDTIANCQLCHLAQTRTLTVPSRGPIPAKIMLVGEAPGTVEDQTGLPFVGPAGHMLDRLCADASIDMTQCFITNPIKCRPPQNRLPLAEELAACRSYLVQLESNSYW
jgi:DNA polymerase